jgi:anti-sigma factor RsiW
VIRRRAHHDPERDVAAYVSGELPPRDLRRFEAHLLECERCWEGVQHNREGRRMAEHVREAAPARLREDVRAAVTLSDLGSGGRRRRRVVIATFGGVAAVLAITLTVVSLGGWSSQPPEIAAALDSYRSIQMPGQPARGVPPDLTAAGLQLVGSGATRLGSMSADMFAYLEPSGGRVVLFLSSAPFPKAVGATEGGGMARGWTATADGVTLFCGSRPTSFLLIGRDPVLLQRVERTVTTLVQ